ncbi:hypothetical protein PLEOSDRAFT_1086368 [Pleurotus ostreatus PC15]|uniref:DUF6533 domain-containing protein n=1 Tax=Pleurotus ostreatus (strain PC15) TaxID=1137138 RepID=A0A067NAP2_PLEO1|nr:hypothetical protein PLEOSDRAFT_1086368 [Pleurotus ostreatus PC15]
MDSTPLSPEQQMEAYQAFLQVTKDTLVLNYLLVAFYALLIYDAALTFECEYIFIWMQKAPLSKGTFMYIVMKYGSIIVQGFGFTCKHPLFPNYYLWPDAPFSFCRYMFYVVQFIPTALFILITVFLAMRTYALWRGQRLVKYLLIALVIFCNVGTFIGISVSSAQVEFMQGNKRIVVGIFKDCLLYYAFLFSTGVVTLVLYLAIPPERAALQGVLINPMRSMSVMIASRIVLNLRRIVLAPGAVTSSELLGTGTDSGYTSTNSIAWGRV